MIVRTYGRRNRSGYSENDVVMGSQESSQDVFDFTFSSQEGKELTILPFGRRSGEERYGGFEEGTSERYFSSKSKKAKVGSDDSEGFGFNSSQESGELPAFPWGKGRGDVNFKGSGGYLCKPDVIKIDDDDDDSDPYGFNSLRESSEFVENSSKGKKKNGKRDENGVLVKRKSKDIKKKKKRKEKEMEIEFTRPVIPTVTLMETQEFGEMMERSDEVNFALDGLRNGQPLRIRRASLLSLLSICATAHQRRLLRAHGLAKTVIDSILGLSFDDSASNLAAAALFFTFTSDGQDDHLLDNPSCIRFLIKLLKPLSCDAAKVKSTTIGSKLLALRLDPNVLQESAKGEDSTIAAIMNKVQEILINCKEIKRGDGADSGNEKPELNPKWISLLTLEKACISTISIEDASGIVRKAGGNFKEKLRELGGLDAVFEVARKCHTIMEGWSERSLLEVFKSKDKANLESLVLLLKCLKLMENATFLSNDNQSHLLEMKGNLDNRPAPRSFVKLVLSAIKILSDVSQQSSLGNAENEKSFSQPNEIISASEMLLIGNKEDSHSNEILSITSSVGCCTLERASSQQNFLESQNSQRLTSSQTESSRLSSETITTTASDSWSLKIRLSSSKSGSCSGSSLSSNNGPLISENGSRMKFGEGNRHKATEPSNFDFMEDSEDPFAFDEDDIGPSKWDVLSGKKIIPQTINSRATIGVCENASQSPQMLSQNEASEGGSQTPDGSSLKETSNLVASCSPIVDENVCNLLAECLLTAVKVLMNLTNENPLGCKQIAEGGGLETLPLLIANHFPSFNSCLPPVSISSDNSSSYSKLSIEANHLKDRNLTDQELDFLVAILGLLVNLVEKDGRNRSRLAAARISFPSLDGESYRDVIPLLCSIFLANQGAGEVAEEGRNLSWDDEEAITQGEKEAEKMIIEAYAALLLAFLSTESKSTRNAIAGCLPNRKLSILVPVLERFVEFHLTLNMISRETHSRVLEVIESCRIP